MSENLMAKTCVPCKGGIPPLAQEAAEKLLAQTEGWELEDNAHHIFRQVAVSNFVEALEFVNKVGGLAEREGHHPDIKLGWGYAIIFIYTHKIDGLHENDFILAAKINQI